MALDPEKLRSAADAAHHLADSASCNEVTGDCQSERESSCFDAEERAGRGFSDFDPHHLCVSCRAYWFAAMAAEMLEHLHALEMH